MLTTKGINIQRPVQCFSEQDHWMNWPKLGVSKVKTFTTLHGGCVAVDNGPNSCQISTYLLIIVFKSFVSNWAKTERWRLSDVNSGDIKLSHTEPVRVRRCRGFCMTSVGPAVILFRPQSPCNTQASVKHLTLYRLLTILIDSGLRIQWSQSWWGCALKFNTQDVIYPW